MKLERYRFFECSYGFDKAASQTGISASFTARKLTNDGDSKQRKIILFKLI